jgi:RimJ/RimL family protein N-acetyltransferase
VNIIETDRLILRTWRTDDAEPFFHINQDPKVLEFVPGPMTRERVQEIITYITEHQKQHGYSMWATELKASGEFMGWVGLNYVDWPDIHFTPAVEVGWRLGSRFWGKGYAPEAAKAALHYGFNDCGLEEIISFTVPENQRSRRVMEKIGMTQDMEANFSHPQFPADHRLSTHVLYRVSSAAITG